MRRVLFLLVVMSATVLIGCSVLGQGQRLRIKNDSAAPITNLRILFPDQQISFGNVAPNSTTAYQVFAKGVYRYAAYQYDWNGQTVTQPVIDWVGEQPMQGDSFTYTLHFDPTWVQGAQVQLTHVTRDP